MCSAGGGVPAQKPTPPQPETVKRVSSEVTRVRTDAKAAAARKYGISGTNVTGGKLSGDPADTKKTKLGGV
jgi:hypothetical protein